MNLPCLTGLICISVIVAAPAPALERTKILGVWELTKSEDGTPMGTTIEFTKDGKVKIATKVGEENLSLEGSYKWDGDKLAVTIQTPDGKEMTDTLTITKLTGKELITKDSKGKTDEFKKK